MAEAASNTSISRLNAYLRLFSRRSATAVYASSRIRPGLAISRINLKRRHTMKHLLSASLVLVLGSIAFATPADASDRSLRFKGDRGSIHKSVGRRSGHVVETRETRTIVRHRDSRSGMRRHESGFRSQRFESRRIDHRRHGRRHFESRRFHDRPHRHRHRAAIVSPVHHGFVPGAVIAGGLIGGVIANEISHGNAAITAAGVLLGTAVGTDLSRRSHGSGALRFSHR